MTEIRQPLDMVLPESLWGLIHLLENGGHRAYVVGGAVRDAVLGIMPKDYDVATDATPDRVLEILDRVKAWRTNAVGKSFGVVRARLYDPNGIALSDEYEIATFRKDVGTGRRPEAVVFTSVEEDVKRRDFTMNALFYDVRSREVVDLVGGLAHMAAGVLMTVGPPEDRFAEDPLRKLRAVRFASRLGYRMSYWVERAITNDPSLSGVSPERIHDELVKSITGACRPPELFDALDRLGLFPHVFPGMKTSIGPDVLVSTRGFDTKDPVVAVALLLDGEDPEALGKKLLALKYASEEIRCIVALLRFRDIDASRAFMLKSAWDRLGLTVDQLSEYAMQRGLLNGRTFGAFVMYLNMPTEKGDTLLAQGYSGRALGEELRRREAVLFEGLLKENT